jgi:hypothetical protein
MAAPYSPAFFHRIGAFIAFYAAAKAQHNQVMLRSMLRGK